MQSIISNSDSTSALLPFDQAPREIFPYMTLTGQKLRIAVLISGGGTNLQAMIDKSLAGSLAAEIVVVLSDRPDAYGLERAKKAGIPTFCVDYRSFVEKSTLEDISVDLDELDLRQKILKTPDADRRRKRLSRLVQAERELIRIIDSYHADYVCLAGFMRLVSPHFIGHFNAGERWRIVNIHPALLPSFPGSHGYEDTFGYGCKWGGITVHFVDEGEDTGPIIAQAVYPVWPDDDLGKVRARGLELEYEVSPQVINWLAQGHISLRGLPGGGFGVVITDPGYPEILKQWIGRAL
jgi:phosphoribosylglycinamide formyltransferase 1